MKYIAILLIFLLVVLIAGLFILANIAYAPEKFGPTKENPELDLKKAYLIVGDLQVVANVASTKTKRSVGLSEKDSLDEKEGLFFIFPEDDKHGIWMKGMNFPIDIIWIAGDGRVVGLKKDAKPESYPKVFYPEEKARYILEVSAGLVDNAKIELGDFIYWNVK